jgi:hypothetical protein
VSRLGLLLYFSAVFVVLLATTTGLILVARAGRWAETKKLNGND